MKSFGTRKIVGNRFMAGQAERALCIIVESGVARAAFLFQLLMSLHKFSRHDHPLPVDRMRLRTPDRENDEDPSNEDKSIPVEGLTESAA